MYIPRRKSHQIMLGNVAVGGDAPISVQSMTNTLTADVRATLEQICQLADAGCEIVRVAVLDETDAAALRKIKKECPLPLVADIHFDYRLALLAIKNGVDGLRINPGNIGSKLNVQRVTEAARERAVPIRIGVNSGSLPSRIISKYGHTSQALAEAALEHIAILESCGFELIKVSVKASSIPLMLESNRIIAGRMDYPLHLGLTEAGLPFSGLIKSSIAIGTLLMEGIGDTIRVSLTADPVREVIAGREILKAAGMRKGLNIIACPTCGRTKIDVIKLAEQTEKALSPWQEYPLTIAVMGCAVNGPGEAREANYGIAGGVGEGLLFAHGEIICKLPEDQLVSELVRLLETRHPLSQIK